MVHQSSESAPSDPDLGDNARSSERNSARPGDLSPEESIRSLRDHLEVLLHESGIFVQALLGHARVGIRSIARTALVLVVAFVVVTFFLVQSSLRLLDGLRGAALAATGSPWLADLLAGACGFLIIAAPMWIVLRRQTRTNVLKLRRKFEDPVNGKADHS